MSAVTLQLPKQVAAIEGRVLVSAGSAELMGVAPLRGGTALSPVSISTGYAFGAYGMQPKNGTTTLRLVMLPKVSGTLDVRVLIDATADANGRRLTLTINELTGSLRVSGGGTRYSAPRWQRPRRAAARRGRPQARFRPRQVGSDNLDVARAGWYSTHGCSTACNPGLGRERRRQR